ncbi:MAG TPA: spore maturation protein [Candidatus Merdenecus merdavium]|nr:spore maturation protein [Candidatus Merdenecus merdavium]
MKLLMYISDFMIPFVIFYIVGLGLLMKRPVYDDFVRGAKEGAKTVYGIMPTLVGLMVGVGVMRASGLLDFIANSLKGVAGLVNIPEPVIPVIIVKMFSSSASTGLVLDIFKEFGTDSLIGRMVSIMMSCTETIFYTMSVYFMTAKVKKTRYTLAGALVATLAGIIASVVLGRMM